MFLVIPYKRDEERNSLKKHVLSPCCVTDTRLGAGATAENKPEQNFCPGEVYTLMGEIDKKH